MKRDDIEQIIAPVVNGLGFELWGIDYFPQGQYSLLRVYIDKPEGITVDDCGSVSHQLCAVLDVEDPITSAYTLEVSSPGLDRPLFKVEQFQQYVGSVIELRTRVAIDKRRKFKGELKAVDEQSLELIVDNTTFNILMEQIEKANVVYQ